MGDVDKRQKLIDSGAAASSPAAVEHAEHGKEFSKEVVDCLQLIATEPEYHYDLCFTGLSWKSGRAFCLTSNIGIPHGPTRNKIVGQLLRDGFTATIVRVFSSATASGRVHHEAMALARSNIDRFIAKGVLPPSMTERLQCTLAGQPMRLMEPTAAAHAVATPLTLRARFYTVPCSDGQSSTFGYDQMDRHQTNTINEVVGELEHDWDETKAKDMMKSILEVAKYEGINVLLTVASDTKIVITPGPSLTDTSIEKACMQHCDRLRKKGETGLACHFVHAPPHRPNPIPQILQSLLQYEPAVGEGTKRWSRASQRTADCAPELEAGSARTFLSAALAGTGRFHPPPASEETALALRSTNSELAKSNVALKQQVAQLGAAQLALRTESNKRMAAFVEAQRAENLRYQEQMVEMHRTSATANAETQSKLDALVRAVTELPDGAQVLRNVFKPPEPPSPAASETAEAATPGDAEVALKTNPDATQPKVGAPPTPELSDGLDVEHEPLTQPTTTSPPDAF